MLFSNKLRVFFCFGFLARIRFQIPKRSLPVSLILETPKKAAVAYLKNTLLEILECPLVSRLENDQTAKVTPKGGEK